MRKNSASAVRLVCLVLIGLTGLTGVSHSASSLESAYVSGRVTGPDGIGLKGVNIYALLWNPSNGQWGRAASDSTEDGGVYALPVAPDRVYRIEFSDPYAQHVGEFWNDVTTVKEATDVVVGTGTVSAIDAQLSRGGHITGIVTGENDVPLADVVVSFRVHDPVKDSWGYAGEGARTDARGFYDIDGVRPGTYRVHFFDQMFLYESEYYDDAGDFTRAKDVVITRDAVVAGINAQMEKPLGQIVTIDRAKPIGTPRVGNRLKVSKGTYNVPVTVKYKWRANSTWIKRETQRVLKVRPVHVGKKISVLLTVSAAGRETMRILMRFKGAVRGARP